MSAFSVEQWQVPSESNPDRTYVVSLNSDDSYSCGCKGWTLHSPRRDCKHIALVKAGGGILCDPLLRAIVKAQTAEAKRRGKALPQAA